MNYKTQNVEQDDKCSNENLCARQSENPNHQKMSKQYMKAMMKLQHSQVDPVYCIAHKPEKAKEQNDSPGYQMEVEGLCLCKDT